MKAIRNEYLEALGIPDFLYSSIEFEASVKYKLLVVELDSEDSFCQSGASQDLLFKMLASIGLSLNDVNLISLNRSEVDGFVREHSSDVILFMDSSIKIEDESLFITHHPKEILKNNHLKRDSWEVLKKVKSCLK